MNSTLIDVAEIEMGQSPPGDSCNTEKNGLPLLNGPTEFGPEHPLPAQWTIDPKRRARKGDLLFCVRGSTTGRMNWADQEYAIGRGIAAIRPRKHQIDRLIRAVIENQLPSLLVSATGSTFPNVSRPQLERLDWVNLNEDKWETTSEFLKTLDDKIALNRKLNETLEGMARALFQSWFVDFDPVKAKLAAVRHGRDPERACMAALSGKLRIPPGKPRPDLFHPVDPVNPVRNDFGQDEQDLQDNESCSQLPTSEEIDQAIAALNDLPAKATEALAKVAAHFPSDFQESELGLIPEGWEVKPFSEICEINPRRTLKKGTSATYVDMKAVPTSGPSVDGCYERDFTSGTKFINGDTLLARITPCLENGKTAYVDFLKENEVGWGSTEFIVIRPKKAETSIGYFLARSDIVRTHAINNMTGTSGRQRVPSECFGSLLIAMPEETKPLDTFGNHASSALSQIKANSDQSRTLAELRDTLLPKLLSGELTVGGSESKAEEALA